MTLVRDITEAEPLSLIDQFAEALSEHGDIARAAREIGYDNGGAYQAGKAFFEAICMALGPQAYDRRPHPSVASIQEAVADEFGIPLFEMHSQRRSRAVARPRQVAMFLAKQKTPFSLPTIGRFFGNRDHTTVIHAIAQVEKLCATDRVFRRKVQRLEARL